METVTYGAEIETDYDAAADVLYLSRGAPEPSESERKSKGILLRFSFVGDAPSGVTVVGFRKNHWDRHLAKLAKIVGSHVGIPPHVVEQAIRKGL